jgi:translation initiation factor IF-3
MSKDNKFEKKDWIRHNEQIRIPQVLVIQGDKNLGVMPTKDAINIAKENGLDLVEVAPQARPPVCHITEYGKFMYEKQKKKKEQQKTSHPKEKEVAFRYVIGDHDLETKAAQIKGFLEKGMKVKCVVNFEKREKAHKDQGFQLLERVIEMLKDVSSVELSPKFEGANVICRLDVKKAAK